MGRWALSFFVHINGELKCVAKGFGVEDGSAWYR
jgi:hypothetical protein